MQDKQIVELFWQRDEAALSAAQDAYGAYCQSIAARVLGNAEDAAECVNDTWLRAWRAIPPSRPERLGPFLGKITRRLAIDRLRYQTAARRGGNETAAALDELQDCLPAADDTAKAVEDAALSEALSRFVAQLPRETARMFLRRYWYLWSVADIAAAFGCSQSAVKTRLLRTRRQLRLFLEKEDITL